MQGYLDKTSTGVTRILGKTKFWCVLCGSNLQYYKESKSTSALECIALKDAQMVRKTNSDRQGTQFQIVMRKQKTYLFTASTAEECTKWVRQLQKAMIKNEASSNPRSYHAISQPNDLGYEQVLITEGNRPVFDEQASSTGIYSEVVDAINKKSTDIYAEVADTIHPNKSGNPVPNADNQYKAEQEDILDYTYKTFELWQDATKEMIDTNHRKTGSVPNSEPSADTSNCYATINKLKPSNSEPVVQEEVLIEGAAVENLDIELKKISLETTAYPLWSELTEQDRQPLRDLQKFLSDNKDLCRLSVTRLSSCNEDPILTMKKFLRDAL